MDGLEINWLTSSEQSAYDDLVDYIKKHIYGKEFQDEAIKLVDQLLIEVTNPDY